MSTVTIRAKELQKGDRFIMLGYEYVVIQIAQTIIYARPKNSLRAYFGRFGEFGLRSMWLVQLMLVNNKPNDNDRSKDQKPPHAPQL